jgi:hypothetical protein
MFALGTSILTGCACLSSVMHASLEMQGLTRFGGFYTIIAIPMMQEVMTAACERFLKPNNLTGLQTTDWNKMVDRVTWLMAPYYTLQVMRTAGILTKSIPQVVAAAAGVGIIILCAWKLTTIPAGAIAGNN